MREIQLLWEHCPGEVVVYGMITAVCGILLFPLVIALMAPARNEMDEVIEE